jgi:hypothetical protein
MVIAACRGVWYGCFSPVSRKLLEVGGDGSISKLYYCSHPREGFETDNVMARCLSWCPSAADALSTATIMRTSFWPVTLWCVAAIVGATVEGTYRSWAAARAAVRKKFG